MGNRKTTLPAAHELLPGRPESMPVPHQHFVNGHPITGPFAAPLETIYLGLGCFWGAERLFWQLPGVYSTSVGYAGGGTANATYREVCSGDTGHTEIVMVVFDPTVITLAKILQVFWESHDPTQGMRQGNDIGTQYRSAIYYVTEAQRQLALSTQAQYQQALRKAGKGAITTEIAPLDQYFYAEEYHQQYLAKNPEGYCGIGGCGVPLRWEE
jgi:peptide-methionine (S)-S-oxide reductase